MNSKETLKERVERLERYSHYEKSIFHVPNAMVFMFLCVMLSGVLIILADLTSPFNSIEWECNEYEYSGICFVYDVNGCCPEESLPQPRVKLGGTWINVPNCNDIPKKCVDTIPHIKGEQANDLVKRK